MLKKCELAQLFAADQTIKTALLSTGSDGDTMLVDAGPDCFVLRRWARKPVDEILHEASLLRYLASQGFPCSPPFEHVFVDGAGLTNALRPFVDGTAPRAMSDSDLGEVGRLLGRLHVITRSVATEGAITRYRLDQQGFLVELEADFPELAAELESLRLDMEAVNYPLLQSSIVHDDVSLENFVRMRDGSLVLIDWSESHLDYSIADIGAAVAQLALGPLQVEMLLDAYRSVAPLSDYEAALIDLVALRRILFLVWYYSGLARKNAEASHEAVLGQLLARARAGMRRFANEQHQGQAC